MIFQYLLYYFWISIFIIMNASARFLLLANPVLPCFSRTRVAGTVLSLLLPGKIYLVWQASWGRLTRRLTFTYLALFFVMIYNIYGKLFNNRISHSTIFSWWALLAILRLSCTMVVGLVLCHKRKQIF